MAAAQEMAAPPTGPFLTEAAFADGDQIAVLDDGSTDIVRTIVVQDASSGLRQKHAALVEEAEIRAEHQSQARLHMLALAAALEESSRQRKELQVLLQREHQTTADLRRKNGELDSDLDRANAHEDARKIGNLESALKSHQAAFLAALLWSRQVAPRCVLLGEDGEEEEFVSAGEATRRLSADQVSPRVDAASLLSPSGASCSKGLEGAEPPDKVGDQIIDDDGAAGASKISRPPAATTPTKGDELTLLWCVKLWRHHVSGQSKARCDEKQKMEERAKEEAAQAKIRADRDRAVESERVISEALNQQLEKTKENLILQERKQQRMEEEHHDLRRRFAIVGDAHETEKQLLQDSLAEAKNFAAKKDAEMDEARQAINSQKAIIDNAEQRLENERQAMRTNLRELGSQLQQAEIMAKHMRETALKAKREAACSVPPERFAELMAELEEMKEKLVAMGKDYGREHAGNITLVQKLEQNTRRLELERQFLPLLHKVRGPVGPFAGKSRKGATASAGALPQGGAAGAPDKLRMGQSQSASFLDTRPASGAGQRPLDTRPASGTGRPRGMPLDGNRRQTDAVSAAPSLRG